MRKKIVAGNWKMNKNLNDGIQLIKEIIDLTNSEVIEDVEIIIAPPFIHLNKAVELLKNNKSIGVSAQNCNQFESGAYTGEISAQMLSSIGVKYVILGHSERRAYFNETNETLALKVAIALKNNLIPIYCCGETLKQRESGMHFNIIDEQINDGLFNLTESDFRKVIIAYEPVWAIGTGVNAKPEEAQEMHSHIRELIIKGYGKSVGDDTSILYGGSCNHSNAAVLFANHDVDGGLIGGASLKSRDFVEIIKARMNK
ncbi:MAG: triose-phosphate isomerase [Bacteroidota bacterium]|nr:triose-phosphate isomerase [Bacteroidota bacterium]